MKTKNICKFISTPSFDKLETHRFIYETNETAMQTKSTLECNRMILVKKGMLVFYIDQAKISAQTGSLIFVFSGEMFHAETINNGEYLYIDFSGNRSDNLFKRFGINAGNRKFDGFDGLLPLWQESLLRASQENIDLATESVLLYSMSRLNSDHNEQNSVIQKILDITEENFDNPNLSISIIAKKLTYNVKYLSHFFKEKMGVGYTEYLRTYRIKYAIMLMDHGIDSVKNIASLCGFYNPQYFSMVFKQVVGVSPSEYKSKQSE